jgi:hypothetical protein
VGAIFIELVFPWLCVEWSHVGWCIYMQKLTVEEQGRAMGNSLFKYGKMFRSQDCVKAFEIKVLGYVFITVTNIHFLHDREN